MTLPSDILGGTIPTVRPIGTSPNHASVSVGTTNHVQLLPETETRASVLVNNTENSVGIYVGIGKTYPGDSVADWIAAGDARTYESRGIVWVKSSSGTITVRATEELYAR